MSSKPAQANRFRCVAGRNASSRPRGARSTDSGASSPLADVAAAGQMPAATAQRNRADGFPSASTSVSTLPANAELPRSHR